MEETMNEKIDYEQLINLLEVMKKYGILNEWILKICNIESLAELNIIQYNFLLAIIKQGR